MKKRIFSILLSLVMVLSMTACVTSPDNSATSQVAPVIEPTLTTVLKVDEIEEMSSEDVSNFLAEMVDISAKENLCVGDMHQIGLNFYDIWWYNNSACNQKEFESQCYKAFCNIYDKALEQQIPLEEIYSWTFVPVPEVLYKYFTSVNFSSTLKIACPAFYTLEEDDAIRIAKGFFENPLFASNCNLAHDVISYPSNVVQEMGLAHLVAISESADSEMLSVYGTYGTCMQIFASQSMYEHTDKFSEIAQNIMGNTHYDFVEKYTFFCNDDLITKSISNMAFEALLELAKNSDGDTRELIKQVAVQMYNTDASNELLSILDEKVLE